MHELPPFARGVDLDAVAQHSISDAARLAGISADTIRRWERQGVITNLFRDDNGDRRFSNHDIETLRQVAIDVKDRMIKKCRESATERGALERLARRRPERTESEILTERVRTIYAAVGDVDELTFLIHYYKEYHATTSLTSIKVQGAPGPGNIMRRLRDIKRR